jgi:hypothetical protein
VRRFLRVSRVWILALPLFLVFVGAASNEAVFAANDGVFPVRYNAAKMAHAWELCQAKGADPDCLLLLTHYGMLDTRHGVMTSAHHLVFLADWIDLGGDIYSPGDLLLELGEFLMDWTPYIWGFLMISDALRRSEEYA